MEFRQHSLELTKSLPPETRKRNGIFFTPATIRCKLLEYLPTKTHRKLRVLEPSCGSGEFIHDLHKYKSIVIDMVWDSRTECYNKESRSIDMVVTGVEINADIYNTIQPVLPNIIHGDFLALDFTDRYDIIVGNPPYFQIPSSQTESYRKKYPELMGKIDIYTIFILKSLQLLTDGGRLLFVIPKTFINTASYDRVRRLLYTKYHIVDIIDFGGDNWLHTKQQTIGLVVENSRASAKNERFGFHINDLMIIHTQSSIEMFKKMLTDADGRTVGNSGFVIKTGEIVCTTEENKKLMTDDDNSPILLHNAQIRGGKFIVSKPHKSTRCLRIRCDKYWITEPVIVVNRGNGNNGLLKFEYAWIDPVDYSSPIIAENHVYKIYDNGRGMLRRLFDVLGRNSTKEYIREIIGNGMMTVGMIKSIPFGIEEN